MFKNGPLPCVSVQQLHHHSGMLWQYEYDVSQPHDKTGRGKDYPCSLCTGVSITGLCNYTSPYQSYTISSPSSLNLPTATSKKLCVYRLSTEKYRVHMCRAHCTGLCSSTRYGELQVCVCTTTSKLKLDCL